MLNPIAEYEQNSVSTWDKGVEQTFVLQKSALNCPWPNFPPETALTGPWSTVSMLQCTFPKADIKNPTMKPPLNFRYGDFVALHTFSANARYGEAARQ